MPILSRPSKTSRPAELGLGEATLTQQGDRPQARVEVLEFSTKPEAVRGDSGAYGDSPTMHECDGRSA